MLKDLAKALNKILLLTSGVDSLLFRPKSFETDKHEYLHADDLNMSVQKFNVTRWIPNFTFKTKMTKLNGSFIVMGLSNLVQKRTSQCAWNCMNPPFPFVRPWINNCHSRVQENQMFRGCSYLEIGSLSMQRFWATDGNRKCTVFLFNLSWHYHIYIVKCLFSSRDD